METKTKTTTKTDTWDESLISQTNDNKTKTDEKELSSQVCH
jgi:hypothetical protein